MSDALIDIVQPAVPQVQEGSGWMWLVLLVAAGGLLAAGIYIWKFRLPAWRAVKRVKALQKKMLAGEFAAHEAMLMLALELRHGLGVKRLRADQLPQQIRPRDHARWPEFMQQMDILLYQHATEMSQQQAGEFFVHAEYWLSRYARNSTMKRLDT